MAGPPEEPMLWSDGEAVMSPESMLSTFASAKGMRVDPKGGVGIRLKNFRAGGVIRKTK